MSLTSSISVNSPTSHRTCSPLEGDIVLWKKLEYMNKLSTPPRLILVFHHGTQGVKPLCDALKISGLGHGTGFSATDQEAMISEWVFETPKRQLLVIGPCDTRDFMSLAGRLKKRNPELLIALVGPKGKDSDTVDHFIPMDAVGPQPFRAMVTFVHEFTRNAPEEGALAVDRT